MLLSSLTFGVAVVKKAPPLRLRLPLLVRRLRSRQSSTLPVNGRITRLRLMARSLAYAAILRRVLAR